LYLAEVYYWNNVKNSLTHTGPCIKI
jgi:hypothetical protein